MSLRGACPVSHPRDLRDRRPTALARCTGAGPGGNDPGDGHPPWPRVLRWLRQHQERLAVLVEDEGEACLEAVAGVDVAYRDLVAVAAAVVMTPSGRVMAEAVVKGEVRFPYVPTYLGFREAPLVARAVGRLGVRPSLVMVDGHGRLHPAGLGSASHAGLLMGMPTVGVAKELLCGRLVGGPPLAPVVYRGKCLAMAVWSASSSRPVFVSCGHRVSLRAAVEAVRAFQRFRIPEPLRMAHMLASAQLARRT